jgi:hypothetical protein
MTPGQSIHAVAIATNTPGEVVFQHDRNLVKAGLRTIGGRGRSAPKVTPLDAARLLTATLGSLRTKDSVATVRNFERAVSFARHRDKTLDPALARLPDGHNFVEALASLISDASGPLQVDDPVQFLRRFSELSIVCIAPGSSFSDSPMMEAPQVDARIVGVTTGNYSGYALNPPALQSAEMHMRAYMAREKREKKNNDSYKRLSKYYGIGQKREIRGSAIVLLGRAFRENGLPFKTTEEAIADLSKAAEGKKRWQPAKEAK